MGNAQRNQRRGGIIKGVEPALPLLVPAVLIAANKAALARHCSDPAVHFQRPVRSLDGVGVDRQLGGQLPYAGQLIPRLQNAGGNLLLKAVDDLGVDGTGIPIIQVYHVIPPKLH